MASPTSAAKDMALVPIDDARLNDSQPSGLVQMIERMASDPAVDVDKFERFMAMHERLQAQDAKAQFFAAFAVMQGQLPKIIGTAKVTAGPMNGKTYANNADIVTVARPILCEHGFSLMFKPSFPAPGQMLITGILGHKGGHFETAEFLGPDDTTGSKNAIQARGSTQEYGIRYTTRALLNITSGEVDDDGAAAGKPESPADYDKALEFLAKAATEGQRAFAAEWSNVMRQRKDICDYILKHDKAKHEGMKATAQMADRKGK